MSVPDDKTVLFTEDPRWRRTSYGKTRTTIYLDEKLWKEFKSLCAREGRKMSTKIERWIADYVKQHSPGNPQQVLGRYNKGKPYIAPKSCYLPWCARPAEKVLEWTPTGTLYACCSIHADSQTRSCPDWKLRGDLEVSK